MASCTSEMSKGMASEGYIILLNKDAELEDVFVKYSETSIGEEVELKKHDVTQDIIEIIQEHATQGSSDNNFMRLSGPDSLAVMLNLINEASEYGMILNSIYTSGDYTFIDIA